MSCITCLIYLCSNCIYSVVSYWLVFIYLKSSCCSLCNSFCLNREYNCISFNYATLIPASNNNLWRNNTRVVLTFCYTVLSYIISLSFNIMPVQIVIVTSLFMVVVITLCTTCWTPSVITYLVRITSIYLYVTPLAIMTLTLNWVVVCAFSISQC